MGGGKSFPSTVNVSSMVVSMSSVSLPEEIHENYVEWSGKEAFQVNSIRTNSSIHQHTRSFVNVSADVVEETGEDFSIKLQVLLA